MPKLNPIDEHRLAAVRVVRGAALLDRVHGPFWEKKVVMEDLSMSSCERCILGQVFWVEAAEHDDPYIQSGYDYAIDDADGPLMRDPEYCENYEPSEFGFDSDELVCFATLRDEWMRVITERLNKPIKQEQII